MEAKFYHFMILFYQVMILFHAKFYHAKFYQVTILFPAITTGKNIRLPPYRGGNLLITDLNGSGLKSAIPFLWEEVFLTALLL